MNVYIEMLQDRKELQRLIWVLLRAGKKGNKTVNNIYNKNIIVEKKTWFFYGSLLTLNLDVFAVHLSIHLPWLVYLRCITRSIMIFVSIDY